MFRMLSRFGFAFALVLVGAQVARANVVLQESFAYPDGDITSAPGTTWAQHDTSTGNPALIASQQLVLATTRTADVNSPLAGGSVSTGNLYASFSFRFTVLPNTPGNYFAHFHPFPASGTSFRGRVFALTSGAAVGKFRLGVTSANAMPASPTGGAILARDLDLNVTYVAVVRYDVGARTTRLWVNPTSEADLLFAAAADTPGAQAIGGYAFRQSNSGGTFGTLIVDNLRVATTFAEIVTLNLLAATPANANAAPGSTDQLIAAFDATASGGTGKITQLELLPAGTGHDQNEVSRFVLYQDNGDGLFSPPSETQLATGSFAADDTFATVGSLPLSVTAAATSRVFVAYDFAAGAIDGRTFSVTIRNPTTTAIPGNFIDGTPIASATLTIQSPTPPTPMVVALSPTSGTTAGGTSVSITGTNFIGATSVTFGAVPASFTVVSPTTITATSPAGAAGPDTVFVTTAGGTSAANPGAVYTYTPPPAPNVTSLFPDSGPTSGVTSVSITGTDFLGATAVLFGATPATGFTVQSATTITATSPAAAAGPVTVFVTTPAGTSAANPGTTYTYVPPPPTPTLSTVSPDVGPLAGGTDDTIVGTDFVIGGTTVTFDGAPATNVVVQDTSTLTCTTPAGSAGPADVVATTAGGSSALSPLFEYVAAPTVATVTPPEGALAGGTSVTIAGTNFVNVTAVTFDGIAATNVSLSSAVSLTCTTPANTAGPASVLVTAAGGTNAANSLYTYVAAPTVASVAPNIGPVGGGTSVTIAGTNFVGVTAVTFGGTAPASFVVVSPTAITCSTPAHAAGAASVVVTAAGGTSGGTVTFTYLPAILLEDAFSYPDGQHVAGSGGAWACHSGATSTANVADGGLALTPLGDGDVNRLLASPAPAGTIYASFSARFTSRPTPSEYFAHFFRDSGTFRARVWATTAGAAANKVRIGITNGSATAPTGAGVVARDIDLDRSVVIVVRYNVATAASTLWVNPTSEADPSAAVASDPQSAVTINAYAFRQDQDIGDVRVDDLRVATSFADVVSLDLSAQNPANHASASPSTDQLVAAFDAIASGAAATLSSLSIAARGTGNDLTDVQQLRLYADNVDLTFNAATDTLLATGTFPADDGTANPAFAHAIAAGATARLFLAYDFAAAVPDARTYTADILGATTTAPHVGGLPFDGATVTTLTPPPPPAVTGVNPASGPEAGGTSVTITGSAFLGATGVTFDGVAATNIVVVSATAITCTTPAGAPGTASVIVTTPGGSNAANALFTYIAAPAVTLVAPASGPTAGGTAVTISGSNFTGATSVTFDGAAATNVVVVNAGSITCTAPPGTDGPASVVVTTPGGSNGANSLFSYRAPPAVLGVSPSSGATFGGTTVTISGANFTGATSVTFDGAAASNVAVVNATTITCTTPAHSAGSVNVVVTTAGGTNAANGLFSYIATLTSQSRGGGGGGGGCSFGDRAGAEGAPTWILALLALVAVRSALRGRRAA